MWFSIVFALGVAHARLFAVPGHGPPVSPVHQRWLITDAAYANPPSQLSSRTGRANVRMAMGFEVDYTAVASSMSIIAAIGASLVKISGLNRSRERRDRAEENLRAAKVALLTGKLDVESYEQAATAAAAAGQEYEAAKTIISVSGADVQIGKRINGDWVRNKVTGNSRAPHRNEAPQMTGATLDRRQPGSKSTNPSSAVGDVMFGVVLAPLLGLFAFSLTPDPFAEGSRVAFDSSCDLCVQSQPNAQSDVESMARVERFLKYTSEPADKFYITTEQAIIGDEVQVLKYTSEPVERFYITTEPETTGNEIFNGHTVDVQSMLRELK